MIRANLLPRRKEFVRFFGLTIARDYFTQGIFGVAVIAITAAIGTGVEDLRLHRLADAAVDRETALAAHATERRAAKGLALDVARYQEFAREAASFRRSGSLAALLIARIGNAVPRAVWLESLERDSEGYTLAGGSQSIDLLAGTVLALGHALPGSRAALKSIDNRQAQRTSVRFRAQLVANGGGNYSDGTQ